MLLPPKYGGTTLPGPGGVVGHDVGLLLIHTVTFMPDVVCRSWSCSCPSSCGKMHCSDVF